MSRGEFAVLIVLIVGWLVIMWIVWAHVRAQRGRAHQIRSPFRRSDS